MTSRLKFGGRKHSTGNEKAYKLIEFTKNLKGLLNGAIHVLFSIDFAVVFRISQKVCNRFLMETVTNFLVLLHNTAAVSWPGILNREPRDINQGHWLRVS